MMGIGVGGVEAAVDAGVGVTPPRVIQIVILVEPRFEVGLYDGSTVTATVIGLDRRTDLAVIKLDDARIYPHLPFGDSTRVELGEWVLAVGAPHGLEGSVAAGVISARPSGANPVAGRLQMDASVATPPMISVRRRGAGEGPSPAAGTSAQVISGRPSATARTAAPPKRVASKRS